jgi:hypothetical protein
MTQTGRLLPIRFGRWPVAALRHQKLYGVNIAAAPYDSDAVVCQRGTVTFIADGPV